MLLLTRMAYCIDLHVRFGICSDVAIRSFSSYSKWLFETKVFLIAMIIFSDHMLLTLLSEILLIIHTCSREYHWPISSTASLEGTPVKSVKLLSGQQYHISNCFHVRLMSTTTRLLVQKLIRTKNAPPPACFRDGRVYHAVTSFKQRPII